MVQEELCPVIDISKKGEGERRLACCLFVCEVIVIGLLHHDDNQLIKRWRWSNGTILVRLTELQLNLKNSI